MLHEPEKLTLAAEPHEAALYAAANAVELVDVPDVAVAAAVAVAFPVAVVAGADDEPPPLQPAHRSATGTAMISNALCR